jgi:hypothetical protein
LRRSFKVELALGHLPGERLGLVHLDRLGGALDQADDIAHAEDAPRDPLGMKSLDPVDRLTRARELDRLAGYRPHRQGRAAARISVHAGQHHPGQLDLLREVTRDVDGVLAGQRIHDQQHFGGIGDRSDRLHLVHQRLIDVKPPRRVEQQHVEALQPRRLQRPPRNLDRLLPGNDRQRRDLSLPAEHRELLLRRRSGDIERGHHDLLAAAPALSVRQPLGDLGGGGGLAGALQADHHDHGGRADVELQVRDFGAEHVDQRVVDDLDDLLPWRDRAQHFLADRALGRLVDELAYNRQRHIRFEQRDPNLAHRRADIRLRQRAAAAKAVEDAAQAIAQTVEHDAFSSPGPAQTKNRRRAKPRRPACVPSRPHPKPTS